jgi:hypothetical protein
MPGIFATRMGEEAFQRILTTKQKTRNDLLGTDTNLTTPIAGKVDSDLSAVARRAKEEAKRKGFSAEHSNSFVSIFSNNSKNPSAPALRQAQGGELVEPQTGPPPLRRRGAIYYFCPLIT